MSGTSCISVSGLARHALEIIFHVQMLYRDSSHYAGSFPLFSSSKNCLFQDNRRARHQTLIWNLCLCLCIWLLDHGWTALNSQIEYYNSLIQKKMPINWFEGWDTVASRSKINTPRGGLPKRDKIGVGCLPIPTLSPSNLSLESVYPSIKLPNHPYVQNLLQIRWERVNLKHNLSHY